MKVRLDWDKGWSWVGIMAVTSISGSAVAG